MLFSLGQGCENLGRAYKNCAKVFLFKAVPAVRRLKKLILGIDFLSLKLYNIFN